MLSGRAMILLGQVFMIVLSAVLALAPRLYMVVILLYLGLVMGLGVYRSRRGVGSASREDVERARTLIKEDKSFELAMEDDDYIKSLSKQMKTMMLNLLLFPVYILIFQLARAMQPGAISYFNSIGLSDPRLAVFATWLIVFESMFLLSQAMRKVLGGSIEPAPMVPASYRVTEKGIVLKSGLKSVISFPLPENTRVLLNESKNYVELRLPKGSKVRLYTRKARRLYEILTRYGRVTDGSGSQLSKP